MLFDKPAKLKVSALSDICLVHPNQISLQDDVHEILATGEPRTDTLVEGKVTLTLPGPRKVRKLQVELCGRQNILVQGQYDTYETLHKIVELDTGAQMLGPGEHTYAFSFVVPSDTASYERCVYGRTYHKLVATAFGLGMMGSDLIAEDNIAVVCNHSETGGVPPGFSMERELWHETLGPVGVNLFSKYLLVAGYLRLGLVLPSINDAVRIEDVKVQLLQTFKLQSLKHPQRTETKTAIVPLWNLRDKEAVCTLKPGQEFEILRQFRLPDDDKIRPSTSDNAITGIRVSQRLAVAIHFTPLVNNPTKQTKELKISTDAVISSCCCMLELLQLPAYQRCRDQNEVDYSMIGYCAECLCKIADKVDVSAYRVPQEELIRAKQIASSSACFAPDKDDETFGAEIQSRRSPSPVSSSTTLPEYDPPSYER